jgi:hypothetical protein
MVDFTRRVNQRCLAMPCYFVSLVYFVVSTAFFWQRWKNHRAHFLLTRIDPFVALCQFRTIKPRPKKDILIEVLRLEA